ncbi:MAG: hypothetical protein JSS95_11050 [Acidobacteria bacterium]|nr:hypothetical protein [Acidobacteriota bacterium]
MAAITTFTCVCGVEKRTSNHWILARVTSDSVTFLPWDWNLALTDDIIVLCGEGCAAALLSRSLGEWKHLPANVPLAMANMTMPQHQH